MIPKSYIIAMAIAFAFPMSPAHAQHYHTGGHHGPANHQHHGHSSKETLDLVERLRGGGHVIFLRHEHTDFDALAGSESTDFTQCEGQRNLSPAGRESAKLLGKALGILKIPVEVVMSSPYCRSRQTAELAFGKAEVTHELIGIPGGHGLSMKDMAAALVRLTRQHAKAGPNTVLVGHFHQLLDLHHIYLQEGEAAVLQPDGDTVKVLGRVLSVQWGDIIRDLQRQAASRHRK